MKTILITTSSFGNFDSTPMAKLHSLGYSIKMNPFGRKLAEEETLQLILEFNPIGIIAGVEKITCNILKMATNLKVISRCGIGMDSVDLSAAKKLNIKVINTPDAPTIPVAELTVGLILSILRKIYISNLSIKTGSWKRPMGSLLYKKKVGIIGCGRIGSYVGKLLSAFDCDVIGYDPFRPSKNKIELVELRDLLSQSDIISLHMPYSKENHHFIDKKKMVLMKNSAIIINTSRGGLIDEDALYEILNSHHLKGAAIDSFEKEPYSGKLKELDNVLMTAHIGSYAVEGRIMMETQAVENLICQLDSV